MCSLNFDKQLEQAKRTLCYGVQAAEEEEYSREGRKEGGGARRKGKAAKQGRQRLLVFLIANILGAGRYLGVERHCAAANSILLAL